MSKQKNKYILNTNKWHICVKHILEKIISGSFQSGNNNNKNLIARKTMGHILSHTGANLE